MSLRKGILAGVGLSILVAMLTSALPEKADPAAGKAIFQEKCAECHNADNKETKDGPGLEGVKKGKLPSGRPATHEVILDLVTRGQESMPAFKEGLTDQQREDVVAYVLTL